MFMLTLIFAAVHSGLASFRDKGEKLIGERAFRVLFAGTSLPLAVSTVVSSRPSVMSWEIYEFWLLLFLFFSDGLTKVIYPTLYSNFKPNWLTFHLFVVQVYFINHRYDGVQLWQLQSVPGLHEVMWLANFISFFFLYPSTFNLLEVAAVDKPKMHLWETGIMRITRHPQVCTRSRTSILLTFHSYYS